MSARTLMRVTDVAACYDRWWERREEFLLIDGSSEVPNRDEWTRLSSARRTEKLVYFIEEPFTGLIKIGISNDPWRRLFELGGQPRFEIVAIESGGEPREAHLHHRFGKFNVCRCDAFWPYRRYLPHESEWFVPATELLAYIYGWTE